MGTVIIFGLVTILAIIGTYTSFKNKNYLGLFFAVATVLVFGFFALMTVIKDGFPEM
ncbi:DUF2759 domain-containing protein [Bacillus andreraoultii]|uniref:DUF2759 domain-containing protein n=1 Tax=Bacillus andreraoultii TaxID=1499685 RepID=UPI00053A9D2F|nr:DUF2759 domain-containing protein [Bacillus andreraoultii]